MSKEVKKYASLIREVVKKKAHNVYQYTKIANGFRLAEITEGEKISE